MAPALRVVVLATAAGCGAPSIHTTVENLCDQVAAVACYDMYQCCTPDAIETLLDTTTPPTEAACRETMKMRCISATAPERLLVARGDTVFDGPAMDRCLEALVVGDSCVTAGDSPPWLEACRTSPWLGTHMTNDSCTTTFDCGRDSFCDGGICILRGGTGTTCASSDACMSGFGCDVVIGECILQGELGRFCGGDDTCASGKCALGVCAGAGFACSHDCSFCMISKLDCTHNFACPTNDSCIGSTCGGNGCVANRSDYCNGPIAALPLAR